MNPDLRQPISVWLLERPSADLIPLYPSTLRLYAGFRTTPDNTWNITGVDHQKGQNGFNGDVLKGWIDFEAQNFFIGAENTFPERTDNDHAFRFKKGVRSCFWGCFWYIWLFPLRLCIFSTLMNHSGQWKCWLLECHFSNILAPINPTKTDEPATNWFLS